MFSQLIAVEQGSSQSSLDVTDSFILPSLSNCSIGQVPKQDRTSNSSFVVKPFLVLAGCQLESPGWKAASLRASSICSIGQ